MCPQSSDTDYDIELYKILIEETRNLHTQWINNFRIILTFNSILIAALFTILVVLTKGEAKPENILLIRIVLFILPLLGVIITLLGKRLISRLYESYKLRYKELRKIEDILIDRLIILPYCEGYKKFVGGDELSKNTKEKVKDIKSDKIQKINGYVAYKYISNAFIITYLLLFIAHFFIEL